LRFTTNSSCKEAVLQKTCALTGTVSWHQFKGAILSSLKWPDKVTGSGTDTLQGDLFTDLEPSTLLGPSEKKTMGGCITSDGIFTDFPQQSGWCNAVAPNI
jgi:hypothetical protein